MLYAQETRRSDTLVVNGNPIQLEKYCYVTSDPVTAYEIFRKREGELIQLSLYLHDEHDVKTYDAILNHLKVRFNVGFKYSLKGITVHTSSSKIWEEVGIVLKTMGYPVIWKQ